MGAAGSCLYVADGNESVGNETVMMRNQIRKGFLCLVEAAIQIPETELCLRRGTNL